MTDSQAGNPLSTGSEDGGWKRVETADDGIGPGRGQVLPKSVSRLPRPRILTQPKRFQNRTPSNLHRKEIGRRQFPERPFAPQYVGMGQPQSQGVGQYFYAPNEGNLGKDIAWRSGLLLADGGLGGDGGGVVSGPVDSRGQWSDSDLNVELGSDGYPRYDGDSNFARRPRTWRFKHHDKDVSLFPMRNQTNSPQPPDIFDVGNESLIYPLEGSRVRGAYGDGVEGYRFGKPEIAGSFEIGESEALIQVPVYYLGKDGKPEGEPLFHVRFWMAENKKSPGKAVLSPNLPAEAWEYPVEPQEAFPPKVQLIDLNENKVARALVQQIPADILTDAAKEMGLVYQGAESRAEEHREAVKTLEQRMGEFFPPEKVKAIAEAAAAMKKGEADDYLRGLGRDLVKGAGPLLQGATAEDVAKFLREAIAKLKAETPEPEPKEFEPPDFNKIGVASLGDYMYSDHKKAYDKLPESEQAVVLKMAREQLGDASAAGYTKEEIQESLRPIMDAATAKPEKAPAKKDGGAEAEAPKGKAKAGEDGLPEDMEPQEKLFRNVGDWAYDFRTYSGAEITPEIREILKSKPEGDGKYFSWTYDAPEKGEATVVVQQKPAWAELQSGK